MSKLLFILVFILMPLTAHAQWYIGQASMAVNNDDYNEDINPEKVHFELSHLDDLSGVRMSIDEGASKGKRVFNWISLDGFGKEGIANGFMLIVVSLIGVKGLCGLLINSGRNS